MLSLNAGARAPNKQVQATLDSAPDLLHSPDHAAALDEADS
jgi:hypothetical protein